MMMVNLMDCKVRLNKERGSQQKRKTVTIETKSLQVLKKNKTMQLHTWPPRKSNFQSGTSFPVDERIVWCDGKRCVFFSLWAVRKV